MATHGPITNHTWIISCVRCGRWRPLTEVGGLRIGARFGARWTLGCCRRCAGLRIMRIEQPPAIPHDRLQTMIDATP